MVGREEEQSIMRLIYVGKKQRSKASLMREVYLF